MDRFFCASASKQCGEPLHATASPFRFLLLLEYDRPWSRNAFAASSIDPRIKRHLAGLQTQLGPCRLLLIRRSGPRAGPLHFYVAVNRELDPYVKHYPIQEYADLLSLDASALARRDPDAEMRDAMLLVCTHGKKDKCCAKYGMPIYRKLAAALPDEMVWQCSHVGGDRFAANVLTLPGCVYYGDVADGDLDALVAATLEGGIYLPKLRGRCCYAPPAQAGEYFLRRHTAESRLGVFRAVRAAANADRSLFKLRFARCDGTSAYDVVMRTETSDYENRLTCSAQRSSRIRSYRLLRIDPAAVGGSGS